MTLPVFSLSGQRVLIIGASGQMGAAVAEAAAALGAHLTFAGRTEAPLAALAERLGGGELLVGDFANAEEALRLIRSARAFHHVVVATSAGARAGSVATTPDADFRKAFDRLWTAANVLRAAKASMAANGSVTLISGSSGRRPVQGFGVWTTLHGAIEALAKGALLDLAPIRVNVVSPGGIGLRPDRQLVEQPASADAIGQAVASLMANPIITGAVLDVDAGERLGGWSA